MDATSATLRESLGGRHRALAQDARLATGQVEHGGRRAGQLARVEDGGDAVEDLVRDVRDAARIGATVEVGARRRDHADPRE